MKIFAYNLCLEFEVKDQVQNYEFSPISFDELMGHLFKGMDFSSQVFYLKGESSEEFVENIFELQRNDVWRNLTISVHIVFPSTSVYEKFLDSFLSRFREVDAAGGLVQNESGDYLCILHRDKWSLPKGGVEWREDIEDAAIREVREETGLKDLQMIYKLPDTFHTFRRGRHWVLKVTHWYKMEASSQEPLVPQESEDITQAIWVSPREWVENKFDTYPLVKELFEQEFSRSLSGQTG